MDANTSSGLSASDVALLSNDNGFGGSNGFFWVFALLLLAGNGFGGWGNNNVVDALGMQNLATSNEVQRGFDAQNSLANEREILSAVNAGTAQAVAATNQTFHDTLGAINDKYSEIARDVAGVAVGQANILANQNECCGSTKMLIAETGAGINASLAQNRYEAALNTASINETTTAQTQRILDAIAQNKIETLQQQVNALELQNATANIVRYPNAWTFTAGQFPCGCAACGA